MLWGQVTSKLDIDYSRFFIYINSHIWDPGSWVDPTPPVRIASHMSWCWRWAECSVGKRWSVRLTWQSWPKCHLPTSPGRAGKALNKSVGNKVQVLISRCGISFHLSLPCEPPRELSQWLVHTNANKNWKATSSSPWPFGRKFDEVKLVCLQ